MPSGVKHGEDRCEECTDYGLFLVVMPSGVKHAQKFAGVVRNYELFLVVMPSGVKHHLSSFAVRAGDGVSFSS